MCLSLPAAKLNVSSFVDAAYSYLDPSRTSEIVAWYVHLVLCQDVVQLQLFSHSLLGLLVTGGHATIYVCTNTGVFQMPAASCLANVPFWHFQNVPSHPTPHAAVRVARNNKRNLV